MKNTIITLASVATLAVSANAQVTFDNYVSWDSADAAAETASGTYLGGAVDFSTGDNLAGVSGAVLTMDLFSNDGTGGGTKGETTITFANAIINPIISFSGLYDTVDFGAGAPLTLLFDSQGTASVSGTQLIGGGSNTPYDAALNNPTVQAQLTGSFTTISWTATGLRDSNAVQIGSVVPEPSSTALLGLGALGLLVRRKR